jgi:hypothetical protein
MTDLEDYAVGYDYSSKIIPHEDLGVKNSGSYTKIEKGVKAIDNYIKALQSADTPAIKDRSALGNKYFHNLGIKCTSEKSGTEEDLYTYYDNVPKEPDDGLVSGIKSQINHMGEAEQANLYNSVYYGSDDSVLCKKILCELRKDDHATRKDVAYVSVDEFNDLIETEKCYDLYGSDNDEAAEGFKNLQEVSSKLPSDSIVTGYYTLLSILGLYFIYNCTINKKS